MPSIARSEIDDAGLEQLATAEREQLAGQLARAIRGTHDLVELRVAGRGMAL